MTGRVFQRMSYLYAKSWEKSKGATPSVNSSTSTQPRLSTPDNVQDYFQSLSIKRPGITPLDKI